MKKNTIVVVVAAMATLSTTTQSCLALATSSVGIAVIKQVLLGGVRKGVGIFGNKNSFLQNDLINAALPQSLVKINNVLQTIAPNLVAKEKDYIAEAAAYTTNLAEPILTNAVNSLNADDVTRISNGTTATQILREKTQQQLIAAILPKVDEKLNQFGIVKSINMALSGSSMLGSIFGGNSGNTPNVGNAGGLSKLASEQMVNGLFNIIEQHEQQNQNNILNAIRGGK